MKTRLAATTIALALLPVPAWAHPGHEASGLVAGLIHPLTGADHLVAMVLVGIWAALFAPAGRTALAVPAAFLAAMAIGFLSAPLLGGAPAEALIITSLVVLGTAAAAGLRAPWLLAVLAAGLFGFSHGLAHGGETPGDALPALFAAGFLLSTAVLHGIGMVAARRLPVVLTRVMSAAAAAAALIVSAA